VRPAAAAVDRYLRRVEPTAANPPHAAAAVDSWDIRADIRTGKQTTMRKDGKEKWEWEGGQGRRGKKAEEENRKGEKRTQGDGRVKREKKTKGK